MGKVRSTSGTSKQKRTASNDPSTSLKLKKSSGKQMTVQQRKKFKAKAVPTVLTHGSSNSVPLRTKKEKHLKDSVAVALKQTSQEGATKRQINVLSPECVTKEDSGLISRVNKKKKQQAQEDDFTSPNADNIPKGSREDIADIPLAIVMPENIDEGNITFSDLNITYEINPSQNMDTSNDADTSHIFPSQVKKRKGVEIPLAVMMPVHSSTPTMGKVKKGKKSPAVDKPTIQSVDIDESGNVGQSANDQVAEISKIPENQGECVESSRRLLSEKDKFLRKVKVHLISNSVVLQLTHPTHFYIFGQVEVQVVNGGIRILGYEMNKFSGSHLVSSLRGSSFLSIQTSRPGVSGKMVNLPTGLQDEAALKLLISSSDTDDVWVLLKEGNQDFLEYIQNYLEYPITIKELRSDENCLLSQAQETLNCIFQPEPTLGKKVTELAIWKSLSEAIIRERDSCTVLCGGKGVGKSTLLRYLVNRVLCSGDVGARGVVVVDLDPGQAEFTPPGCVAVSLIKTPLLGPNYTHLQQPERCVCIGEISVTQCLGRYMEAAASVIQFWRESPYLATLPCIVNTMGFTRGIGVTIMGQLVKLTQPTRVVQIESKRFRENYPFHLTRNEVISHSQSTASLCIKESLQLLSPVEEIERLNYELVILQSGAEAQKSKDDNVWGMKPKIWRDAVILSYFAPLAHPPSFSLLDDMPFSCPLGTLFLGVAHENVPPNITLAAMHGNMVSLCTIDPTTSDVLIHPDPDMPRVLSKIPTAPCIGFGIVRGVDMQAKMLYLSTPLQGDKLCLVNCLIYGAVNLPTSVDVKSTAPGLIPYVSSGYQPDIFTQSLS